jgi:hypothetical protein
MATYVHKANTITLVVSALPEVSSSDFRGTEPLTTPEVLSP